MLKYSFRSLLPAPCRLSHTHKLHIRRLILPDELLMRRTAYCLITVMCSFSRQFTSIPFRFQTFVYISNIPDLNRTISYYTSRTLDLDSEDVRNHVIRCWPVIVIGDFRWPSHHLNPVSLILHHIPPEALESSLWNQASSNYQQAQGGVLGSWKSRISIRGATLGRKMSRPSLNWDPFVYKSKLHTLIISGLANVEASCKCLSISAPVTNAESYLIFAKSFATCADA